jgi:hypothetical protein
MCRGTGRIISNSNFGTPRCAIFGRFFLAQWPGCQQSDKNLDCVSENVEVKAQQSQSRKLHTLFHEVVLQGRLRSCASSRRKSQFDNQRRVAKMGFSILGFQEDSPAGTEQGSEKRLYRGVESGDEGRHFESPSQMQIMTSEDDVRDPSSNDDAATPFRDVPSDGYHAHRASTAGVAKNSSTILGDMTLFRDFFVAAFSDYNVCITHNLSLLFPKDYLSNSFTRILLIVFIIARSLL